VNSGRRASSKTPPKTTPPAADRTVAETVDRRLNELRPAERRAAVTLLADYPGAGLGTMADLAQRAEVSPPSVMRFAPGLGYDGFTAVQSALREELTAVEGGRWDVSAGTASTDRILSCCFDVPGRFPTWPSCIGSV
jgi:DNA-binding MurR/RpiR family transcriptional regulator